MNASRVPTDTALRTGIVLLTLGTAIIHLQLAFPDPVFILNGLGYLTLLVALQLPQLARYRNVVRWVLVGYAALTIFIWVLIGASTPIGYIDKAIEVSLITLLLLEIHRSASGGEAGAC